MVVAPWVGAMRDVGAHLLSSASRGDVSVPPSFVLEPLLGAVTLNTPVRPSHGLAGAVTRMGTGRGGSLASRSATCFATGAIATGGAVTRAWAASSAAGSFNPTLGCSTEGGTDSGERARSGDSNGAQATSTPAIAMAE